MSRREEHQMARVDELAGGIYRISTTVQLPDTEFQFNQFLIDDECLALIHTGMYGLYDGVRDGIAEVLDPGKTGSMACTAAASRVMRSRTSPRTSRGAVLLSGQAARREVLPS
jgi:hypothetical protein